MSAAHEQFYMQMLEVWQRMPAADRDKYPEIMEGIEFCERASGPKRSPVFTKADEITLHLAEAKRIMRYQIALFAATIIGFPAGILAVWAMG